MSRIAVHLSAVLACVAGTAQAACPEKLTRIPEVVELAQTDAVIAATPTSAEAFEFVDDTTTLDGLMAKVGTPHASRGLRTFYWCLPDGTVVSVISKTGTDIRYVRVDNKVVYKRK